MDALTLHGRFTPPAMGHRYAPYPITGPGQVALTPDGLVLAGTRASGRYWIGILGTLGAIAGLAIAVALELKPPKLSAAIVMGLAALGGAAGHAVSRALSRRPQEVTLPWSRVRAAQVIGGELLVRVRLGVLRTFQVHFTYDDIVAATRLAERVRTLTAP